MLTVVPDARCGEQPTLPDTTTIDLDEICRLAARQMLALAWRPNGAPTLRPTPT